MDQTRKEGYIAGVSCYALWGLLPLYLIFIRHVGSWDIVAHRIFWSVPTGICLVLLANRWDVLISVLKGPQFKWLVLSSCIISINWLLYVWAVENDRIIEASLGYFLNPLVNVLIGTVFLSERLRRLQWVAIAIAAIAVVAETYALGRLPWIALVLAFSFSAYGLVRKQLQVDIRIGFTLEVLFLLPFALAWFAYSFSAGQPITGERPYDIMLLMLAGPVTATPLMLFAFAAKRLKFSTIGMLQYIGPTLQMLVGILLGELITELRMLSIGLIFCAVIVFSIDLLRQPFPSHPARPASDDPRDVPGRDNEGRLSGDGQGQNNLEH